MYFKLSTSKTNQQNLTSTINGITNKEKPNSTKFGINLANLIRFSVPNKLNTRNNQRIYVKSSVLKIKHNKTKFRKILGKYKLCNKQMIISSARYGKKFNT